MWPDISIKNTGTFSQPSGREIQHVTFTVPANVGLNIPVQYRIYTALDKTTYQASNVIYANYSLIELFYLFLHTPSIELMR